VRAQPHAQQVFAKTVFELTGGHVDRHVGRGRKDVVHQDVDRCILFIVHTLEDALHAGVVAMVADDRDASVATPGDFIGGFLKGPRPVRRAGLERAPGRIDQRPGFTERRKRPAKAS